jgi:kinesin family protein 6/9
LKVKYAEAKAMGERANSSRSTVNYLKRSIEAIRREKAMEVPAVCWCMNLVLNASQGVLHEEKADGLEDEPDSQEERYRKAIEHEKSVYKESFTALRELKAEIEHIQTILEKVY